MVVQEGDTLQLRWIPPESVNVFDIKSLRTTAVLGEITGVFDCTYEEDDDVSLEQQLAQVSYEVEVAMEDSDMRSFFGFRKPG